jgi:predicted SAM-dependent methyltransferase
MPIEENIYVHYGCGQAAPPEWKNFDVSPTLRIQKTPILGAILKSSLGQVFDKNVQYGDITEGLPGIKDGTVSGAYCSHVLEHMSLEHFRIALRNTYKMLKPGGIFRIIMPDLEVLIRDYINDKDVKKDPEASITLIKRMMMGVEVRPRNVMAVTKHLFGYLEHLWLWDWESTEKELRDAGFTNIRRCEFNDSADPMFKLVENKKRWELVVKFEAIK